MVAESGTVRFTALADFSSIVRESRKATDALRRTDQAVSSTFGDSSQTRMGQFGTAMGRAQSQLASFGDRTRRTGQQMSLGITLPLTIMGGLAVRTFANFDTAMQRTGAVSNATESEFNALREAALQLGADSQFSATQAAEAMYELSSAGLTVDEMLDGATDSVLLLAGATGVDLAQAAAVVSQSMNAFGIESADTAHVADVMTQAVNQSAIDMQGLAEAFEHVGVLGPSAGQSIESVTAMVEVLVNQGQPAAMAGTAIQQMFQKLTSPAMQRTRDMLNAIGVQMRDANGEILEAPDLLENMARALDASNPRFVAWANSNEDINEMIEAGTIAESARLAVARDMITTRAMGTEGQRAFNLLLNGEVELTSRTVAGQESLRQMTLGLTRTMGEDMAEAWIAARMEGDEFVATGADAVRAMAAMNEGADGVAATFEEKMGRSLARRMEEFKGSLETLTIRVIDGVLPALERLLPMMIGAANAMGRFAENHPQLMMIAVGLLAVLAVMGPILSVVGGMAKGLSAVIGGLAKLGTWLVVTAAKWGLLGASAQAAAAQQAAAAAAASGGTGVGGLGLGAMAGIVLGVLAVIAAIAVLANKWDAVWTWMKENKALAGIIGAITAWVIGPIMAAAWAIHELWTNWDQVMKWMGDAAAWLGRKLAPVWQAMQTAWDAVTRVAVAAWHLLQQVWDGISGAAVSAWHLLQTVWQAMQTAWDVITSSAVAAWHLLQSVWDGISGAVRTAWGVIQGIFNAIASAVENGLMPVFNALTGFFEWQFDLVVAIFQDFLDIVRNVFAGVKRVIAVAWSLIRPVLEQIRRMLAVVLVPAFRLLKTIVQTVWNAVSTAIRAAWRIVSPIFSSVWNWVKTKIPTAFNAMKRVVVSVWDGIKSKISGVWNTIKGWFQSMWDWAQNKLPAAFRVFKRVATNAWDGVKRGIRTALQQIGNLASGFLGVMADIANAVGLESVGSVLQRGSDSAGNWGEAEQGAEIGPGFVTKGASVVVGEGRRQHPEFVIPTDPRYRKRALGLFESLGGQLMAQGGVIAGGPQDWLTGGSLNIARVLSDAFDTLWGLFDAPETVAGIPPAVMNTVRENVIDKIRGEASKMMASIGGANADGIQPWFLSRWSKYNANRGNKFSITSGFRTFQQQSDLYYDGVGAPAAPPGTSNHEFGLAIDHSPDSSSSDRAAAGRFQLHYPMSYEPWHIEPFETRKKGGLTDKMTMALLHPNEMTLPSAIALPLKQAVTSGALSNPPPVEVTVFLGDEDLTAMLTDKVIVKSGLSDVRRRARAVTRVS